MNFASDNATGASDEVMAALTKANEGVALPYGADPWTAQAQESLSRVFERDCAVFLVPTGTASNALALACLTPPYGAVFCHEDAHVMGDECGAPEFYTGGAKLVGLPGPRGRIEVESLRDALRRFPRGLVKQVQPAALSVTQATEAGTLYGRDELRQLCAEAHAAGLSVHMDGARFANALVTLGCSPADLTWRAGVDVLSFGATKNGTLCCEAVIFFDRQRAADFAYRRKRAGHTLSKGRFIAVQMLAYLEADHWLMLARHANAMARRMAEGLSTIAGVRVPWGCDANEIFPVIPARGEKALKAAGALYYNWGGRGLSVEEALVEDEMQLRLVTSFRTTADEVDRFVETLGSALR